MLSDDMKALLVSQPKTEALREYRWTAPMFYRALDAGAFGLWPKVELVRGRIIEHPGQTPLHANSVRRVSRRFRNVLEPALRVFEHYPLTIAEDTHIDADVLVVSGQWSDDQEQHPGPADTALLVEVSDLTVSYDLGEKALLYAAAGIVEYWVVLAQENAVVRHREPTPNGYQSVMCLVGADMISPLALPEAVWAINMLLGREEAPREN
jgi:Uma2 family endonuclease